MSPKLFISYASEDKHRFVDAVTTRLRKNGVDAWLDRWEMLPGEVHRSEVVTLIPDRWDFHSRLPLLEKMRPDVLRNREF